MPEGQTLCSKMGLASITVQSDCWGDSFWRKTQHSEENGLDSFQECLKHVFNKCLVHDITRLYNNRYRFEQGGGGAVEGNEMRA